MRKRAYVLIFSFWAFLTIITPTLIQWSVAAAQAQATEHINDNFSTSSEGVMITRKMLVMFDGINRMPKAPPPWPLSPEASPPSPSPAVQPFEQAKRLQQEFVAEDRYIQQGI